MRRARTTDPTVRAPGFRHSWPRRGLGRCWSWTGPPRACEETRAQTGWGVDDVRRRLGVWFWTVLLVPTVALTDQRPLPPAPTGHDLYRLPLVAFRAYVGGIQDGQSVLAEALGIQQIICLDAGMTRNDLASLVLYALPKLPKGVMDLPANEVVFRVLVENVRCPGVDWKSQE